MERKPIVETYQPRQPDNSSVVIRTYVPQKPTHGGSASPKPQAVTIVAKPSVNKG